MESLEKDNKALSLKLLEETRIKFHQFVGNIKEEELNTPSKFTKRSVKGVLAHILISSEKAYPMLLKRARKSKPMPYFFGTKLGHYFSYKYSEYIATKMSTQELVSAYDESHSELVKLIEEIKDEEWDLKTALPKPSKRELKVLEIFTWQIPNHFKVHCEEIKKSINYKN